MLLLNRTAVLTMETVAPIRYPLAQDTLDREDLDSLIQWLKTYPRLTQGRLTLQFQQEWSRWLGRKCSVFCNSGSSANLLMYDALLVSGRLQNKKVVVPSVGWSTSAAPALQLGFEPLLCEADPETYGLDLSYLEGLLKRHRPSTVFLVQVLGVPHKMEELLQLKREYGFFLLEDACAAVGSEYRGRKAGSFGDLSSFSFYFGHQLSTIEGGMVCTDDPCFNNLLLMLRSHGWGKDLDADFHRALLQKHHVDNFHAPFVFYEPGFNLRSTDLNAYLGLRQMKKIAGVAQSRHANHQLYQRLLGSHFEIQRGDPDSVLCSISFAAVAKDAEQRKRIVVALEKNGIEARLFSAGNLGRHPFWIQRYGEQRFPVADRVHDGGFFLPNHPHLRPQEISTICQVVLDAR